MENSEFKDKGKGKAVDDQPSPIKKRKRPDGVSALSQMIVLVYERSVEIALQDQIEKYTLFTQILDDLNLDRISGDEVMKKMNTLLQGHEELLVGLKGFLSSCYELKTGSKHLGPLNITDAMNFFTKVKEYFGVELTKFKTFLDILTSYRENDTTYAQVYSMAARLFEDRQDLFEDFRQFIPRQS